MIFGQSIKGYIILRRLRTGKRQRNNKLDKQLDCFGWSHIEQENSSNVQN